MGCASSRVMHLQADRDDNLANASPKKSRKRHRDDGDDDEERHFVESSRQRHRNHFVALTSSTYGVLEHRKKVDVDITRDPEVINAVELMKGLEGDHDDQGRDRRQKQQQDCYALSQTSHHPRGSSSNSSCTTYEIVRELHRSDQEQHKGDQCRHQCENEHRKCGKKMRCMSSKASNSTVEDAARSSSSASTTSRSVFDPELLESMEKALEQISEEDWNKAKEKIPGENDPSMIPPKDEEEEERFQRLCPPCGESRVVVYLTSLRGVRKTHEECSALLAIVAGYGVGIDERDLSMHQAFRKELHDLTHSCTVPQLFVRGRFIGGLEEVSRAHEEGILQRILQGIQREDRNRPCDGCGGARFILCLDCSGSCKILAEDGSGAKIPCLECNENGLIRCPICC